MIISVSWLFSMKQRKIENNCDFWENELKKSNWKVEHVGIKMIFEKYGNHKDWMRIIEWWTRGNRKMKVIGCEIEVKWRFW